MKRHERLSTNWLSIAKIIWLIGTLMALALFARRIPELIDFSTLLVPPLLIGGLAISVSHACVSGIREITTRGEERPLNYRENAVIFNASNLSKYLPIPAFNIAVMGWMLKRAGLSSLGAGRSILLGVYWTASSALLIGLPALSGILSGFLLGTICWVGPLIWLFLIALRPERWIGIHLPYSPFRLGLLQLGVWVGYGAAFALTTYAVSTSISAISSFAVLDWIRIGAGYIFSYGAGLLAIFAPAGAGVREAGLALALSDYANPVTWVAIAILARAVIFLGDLFFAAIVLILGRQKTK